MISFNVTDKTVLTNKFICLNRGFYHKLKIFFIYLFKNSFAWFLKSALTHSVHVCMYIYVEIQFYLSINMHPYQIHQKAFIFHIAFMCISLSDMKFCNISALYHFAFTHTWMNWTDLHKNFFISILAENYMAYDRKNCTFFNIICGDALLASLQVHICAKDQT